MRDIVVGHVLVGGRGTIVTARAEQLLSLSFHLHDMPDFPPLKNDLILRAARGAHLERLGNVGAHEGDGAEVVEDLDEHAVDFGNAAYPSRVTCGGR